MPRIAPFRALRYAPSLARALPRLIAPPYDVIAPADRTRLAGEPHNIVRLDLPEAGPDGEPYLESARLLRAWRDAGVLERDSNPAYYLCEQRFAAAGGASRVRRGFFARLRLEPLDGGVVLPHERTLDRPRRDRERLLAATRTHLSAVFMLHPDAGGAVAALLADAAAAPAEWDFAGPDGVGLRVWRITQPAAIDRLTTRLDAGWALIADGHHRYESALQYRDERRAAGHDDAGEVLVYLCSTADPGLAIAPIHRVVRGLPGFEPARFRQALEGFFDLEPQPRERLAAEVAAAAARPGVFGFVFAGEPGGWRASWREGAGLDRPGLVAVPEALRRLDVILLHRLVLEELLGITPEAQRRQDHIDYVKDEAALWRGADAGSCGILLNPTRLEQVVEVSRIGLRLPQKSTYFHPKVPSGLVLDPIDG